MPRFSRTEWVRPQERTLDHGLIGGRRGFCLIFRSLGGPGTPCDNWPVAQPEPEPVPAAPRRRRWLRRTLQGLAAVLVLGTTAALIDGCTAFGKRSQGPRLARMERSPEWRDGKFHNPQPLVNSVGLMLKGAFGASAYTSPATAIPTVPGDRSRFASSPASGLRVTWMGHSSVLVEIDGRRVLTDPVLSHRASPFGWVGPQRWYPPPIPLAELPALDAVVISHDHYDHLDRATIVALKDRVPTFVVPLGLGAHLAYWGVPGDRIVELDWWERAELAGLTIACTPARHASGRMLVDNDKKLWAGFAFLGPAHRVYFSGDTGLFPAMRDIGERLGPFDLTMIEAGQYDRAWPDWHAGPEQAVRAHQLVRGRVMLPVHWGLFTLAYHGWTEPIERVIVAAGRSGVPLIVPRPGASVEPSANATLERWWPEVPWQTAAEHPVVSTQME
jgi:L-ascorbate metabolism protein UlaG (beta-lactamase superfamily)